MKIQISLCITALLLLSVLAFGATYDTKEAALAKIAELDSAGVKGKLTIEKIESRIDGGEEEVFWNVHIYKEWIEIEKKCTIDEKTLEETCEDVGVTKTETLHDEVMSSIVSSEMSNADVGKLIKQQAKDWYAVWKSQQKVSVRAALVGQSQTFALN